MTILSQELTLRDCGGVTCVAHGWHSMCGLGSLVQCMCGGKGIAGTLGKDVWFEECVQAGWPESRWPELFLLEGIWPFSWQSAAVSQCGATFWCDQERALFSQAFTSHMVERHCGVPIRVDIFYDVISFSKPCLANNTEMAVCSLFKLLDWAFAESGDKCMPSAQMCEALGVAFKLDRSMLQLLFATRWTEWRSYVQIWLWCWKQALLAVRVPSAYVGAFSLPTASSLGVLASDAWRPLAILRKGDAFNCCRRTDCSSTFLQPCWNRTFPVRAERWTITTWSCSQMLVMKEIVIHGLAGLVAFSFSRKKFSFSLAVECQGQRGVGRTVQETNYRWNGNASCGDCFLALGKKVWEQEVCPVRRQRKNKVLLTSKCFRQQSCGLPRREVCRAWIKGACIHMACQSAFTPQCCWCAFERRDWWMLTFWCSGCLWRGDGDYVGFGIAFTSNGETWLRFHPKWKKKENACTCLKTFWRWSVCHVWQCLLKTNASRLWCKLSSQEEGGWACISLALFSMTRWPSFRPFHLQTVPSPTA